MSPRKRSDRAAVFARGALLKGYVTREQAEECVALARKLKRRGKATTIEVIFIRKGYLTKAEARSIAKRVRAASSSDRIEVVEELPSCPCCGRDPGSGDDCFRCGADLETGAPGPRGTLCEACGRVVLRGTAICPRCAEPIKRKGRGKSQRNVVFDRLILLATLGGMGYFLVYLAFFAPTAVAGPERGDASPLDQAKRALGEGDRALSAALLDSALGKASPEEAREINRALALLGKPDRARRAGDAARGSEGNDPQVRLRLAHLALEADDRPGARRELGLIPEGERGDGYWRLVARVERAEGGDWLAALERVEAPTSAEHMGLVHGLLARGRAHSEAGRSGEALADVRRACRLAPDLPAAQFSLGLLLLEAGDHSESQRALQEAIQLDPRPAAPYLALGLVFEALGKAPLALANYREFVRLAREEGGAENRISRVEKRISSLAGD